jgi:hypothetical protein
MVASIDVTKSGIVIGDIVVMKNIAEKLSNALEAGNDKSFPFHEAAVNQFIRPYNKIKQHSTGREHEEFDLIE